MTLRTPSVLIYLPQEAANEDAASVAATPVLSSHCLREIFAVEFDEIFVGILVDILVLRFT